MPVAQYNGCPRTTRNRHQARVIALVAVLAASPAIAARPASAEVPIEGLSSTAPEWNFAQFWGYLWTIWTICGGDAAYFEARATSPESAMRLVNELYVQIGSVPDDLTLEEQTELRAALTDAEAMLRVAPLMEQSLVRDFLKTLSDMWVDLGGYPGDLGR